LKAAPKKKRDYPTLRRKKEKRKWQEGGPGPEVEQNGPEPSQKKRSPSINESLVSRSEERGST